MVNIRIIDAHAHILNTPKYQDKLLETMDKCGIEECCISGLGPLFQCVGNEQIKPIVDQHPDRFIGAFFVRPGVTEPKEIPLARENGFKMLKVTIPKKPYDDPSFFPLWEYAQDLKLPILFHTGIVTLPQKAPNEGINSWFMHPMRLEPIANAFPDLNIIIAHLGVHWNDDAAELLRLSPNVYADLTGEPEGWRLRADQIGLKKWLWWKGAFKKIIFGTDVHYEKILLILEQDMARLEHYNIDEETKELIFSKNIMNIIGG